MTEKKKVTDIRKYRRRVALREQGRRNWNRYIERQEQAYRKEQAVGANPETL